MTSGNISDEPLVIDNAEAVARLGGMCDAILWHDRPIERCVDDSVVIDVGDGPVLPIRRSRGYAPMAIRLPIACDAPGLCVGGELKNTIAVVRGGEAILSQHMGDLTHPLALEYFRKAAADLMELFGVRPAWIAHDLHPLYQSHVYARQLARELGAELIGVQHHHAHAAALLAEHGETGPILAVVCDGVGYGEDGAIWGGELLKVDLGGHERLGHLDPLELPGGDAAVKDTRRCALALLKQAMGDNFAAHPLVEGLVPDATERRMLVEMLRSGVGCVTSTGAGRVFDGVSAILGLCGRNEFEAQAGMALESAASAWERTNSPALSQKWESETADRLTLAPFARYAADCMAGLAGGFVERGGLPSRNETVSSRPSKSDDLVLYLAWLFHEEFCRAWDRAVGETSERTGLRTVGLSGGVMCNERVTRRLTELLTQRGLRVLRHAVVPPNDGGIALGQAAVAMKRRIDRG